MGMEERPRDENGQFLEQPDSLHPKMIGLRISKNDYPKLMELAKSKGCRPTVLVRQAVTEYLKEHYDNSFSNQ